MFETLFKVVPLTANAFQWLLALSMKDREQFASLCQRIGEDLESFARESDNQNRPRNLCAELAVYVPEIEAMAGRVRKDNPLREMAQALNNVCDAWKEYSMKLGQSSFFASDLYEVQDAAGHFRGLANLVRHL